jgi:hypothetical protein
MRIHYYFSEYDDSFDEYTDSIKHDLLKERLAWQHRIRKQLHLEYEIVDDDFESNLDYQTIFFNRPARLCPNITQRQYLKKMSRNTGEVNWCKYNPKAIGANVNI